MSKKNLFTQVEMTQIKSNVFDLSHDVKLSLKMGDLVPIMCTECVPGDKFNISCESLLRFAPLTAPVMHRMDVTMHYFFVPYRLLWNGWESFITNTKVSGVVPAFPVFQLTGATMPIGSLADYLGLPAGSSFAASQYFNAMPFAAYQKIYNEYYRDQNLVTEVVDTLQDGDNNAWYSILGAMRKRAWEHDYFTSALPWPQKGAEVNLPVGNVIINNTTNIPLVRDAATHATVPSVDLGTNPGSQLSSAPGAGVGVQIDPNGTLGSDPTSITDLRRAFKLQEWLERAARGGTRYIEFIRSMFGVRSSDKRLQRPEYITGVKSPVVISEVLNTTGTDDAPQGAMAGHGVSVTTGNYGNFYCEEHGLIMGIMSVMPKTAYQQGVARMWDKIYSPFDYFFEQFQHIGEQAVKNRELFVDSPLPEGTFGYVPRYAEYKFENNRVAGDFRNNLDYWHLGRKFATSPALNQVFIECVPDTRIFAVEDGSDYLWAHVYNKVKAVRKMAYFGNPHF